MERIRSETALRESEEKYRTLVETSPDAIVMIDLEGYVVTANQRFAELLGSESVEEIIASRKMVFDYLDEEDRAQAKKDSDMLLDGLCAVSSHEYTVKRFDGSEFPADIGMSLLRDEHGEPRAYIGILRNITERREAEQRHADAVKMAERSSRLASVGTLAAGISHEINQPLTALKVKVDSMLYWKEMNIAVPQDDLDQDLKFISQQTERIDDIIKHMRALARQEKGRDPVDINLNGVIGDVIPLLRQRISAHGIHLVQNLDTDLSPVRGHKTLLQQVVINLIVNAINALDESKKKEKTISVSTSHDGDACYMEVTDNGPGIPEKYLNRIFDPFFTTKIGSEGMGLGLSICHNIVTGMGGTITVENTREGGARFLVSIPVSRSEKESQ
jgi:PAS domain S-box-containing protein